MTLEDQVEQIRELDHIAMTQARERWNQIAKPLSGLGLLEDAVVKIAGICGSPKIDIRKKALVVMCADNGIVEEGVTQTGQEVTAVVTEHITQGDSCVCIMAELAGVDVYPVDIGVAGEYRHLGNRYPLIRRRIANGTRNFSREPAMTAEETRAAIEEGIKLVERLKRQGYGLIATGEMGIGNTTTSSAVASVLLGKEPELMTGRGAGLSDEGLTKKISVIREAIEYHKPNWKDGIDVLSKVGGFDLAGLTGVYLGGAIYRIPVIIDGFISAAAALTAASICRSVTSYMLASHVSAEPAGNMLLQELGQKPLIYAEMCLGEGTGALALVPLLDMAAAIYERMSTFEQIAVNSYQPL